MRSAEMHELHELTNKLFVIVATAPGPSFEYCRHRALTTVRDREVVIGYRDQQPVIRFQEWVLQCNEKPVLSWDARLDRYFVLPAADSMITTGLALVLKSLGLASNVA